MSICEHAVVLAFGDRTERWTTRVADQENGLLDLAGSARRKASFESERERGMPK